MTTWDDKPNDYDHACRIIERLQAQVSDLEAALDVWNSNELGLMIAKLRAALEAIATFPYEGFAASQQMKRNARAALNEKP